MSICVFEFFASLSVCLFQLSTVSLSVPVIASLSVCLSVQLPEILLSVSLICLSVFSVINSRSVCSGHSQSVYYHHSLCLPHPGLFQSFSLSVIIWPVFSSVFSSFASVTVYLLMIIITLI